MTTAIADPAPADEAQALISSEIEWGTMRNGVIDAQRVVVRDDYYEAAELAALEQLTLARNIVMRHRPRIEADSLVERLVRDGVIRTEDVARARDQAEFAIRRSLDTLAGEARDRLSARLPIALRSLISLITVGGKKK